MASNLSTNNTLYRLPNLQSLYLNSNQISNINALKGLTNLKELELPNTQVSSTDQQTLKNDLSCCSIDF